MTWKVRDPRVRALGQYLPDAELLASDRSVPVRLSPPLPPSTRHQLAGHIARGKPKQQRHYQNLDIDGRHVTEQGNITGAFVLLHSPQAETPAASEQKLCRLVANVAAEFRVDNL